MNWPHSRTVGNGIKCHHSRVLVMPADCVSPWNSVYDRKETYGPERTAALAKFKRGESDPTKSLWVADFALDTVKITSPDQIDWEGFNGEEK